MRTKLLTALFAVALLFAFSSVQSVFAQDDPHAYLNVTVYGQLHVGLINGAEVQVFNSSGEPVTGQGYTGPPTFENGMVAFDISSFGTGTYTIRAWYYPRPNDFSNGETIFYYSGSGSENKDVVLGPSY